MTKRDDLTSWPVGQVLTPSGWVPISEWKVWTHSEEHTMSTTTWEELFAKLPQTVWICTRFEDEPYVSGEHYGVEGDATTRLRSLTHRLWMDYCIRQGHTIPLPATDEWTILPDWMQYRVYLRDDTTNTPLDTSKTLGELGITERHIWVRFERAI